MLWWCSTWLCWWMWWWSLHWWMHRNLHKYNVFSSRITIFNNWINSEPSISNFNGSVNRDCRGMCIPPELSRPQQQTYDRDECGICRLQNNEPSPFIDCQRNCQLPGIVKVTNVCGQCVNSNHSLVLDECGNCRSERKYCSCDR